MHILQITDTHLYGNAAGHLRGVETDSSLRTVLAEALGLGLSRHGDADPNSAYAAMLVTGDVVQDDPTGYLRFKSILGGLRLPILCVPGNHDEPDIMRQSLAQTPFQYCGELRVDGWQFVMLDSCHPGHVGGRLADTELERLERVLAGSSVPTLICLHHHPVAMQSRWMDDIGLTNADELWRIVDAHPHVRGVAWGHVHQAYESARNGVRLFATPSTCAQFVPHSDEYAVDSRPPAYRHFDLRPDGTIVSEIRWVESVFARRAAVR